jgi:hypothetical protein
MILWKRYGTVHIGTTDCGLRFEVRRYAGERCYSLSMRTAGGGEAERSTGYQSVRAAQVAALVTTAGRRKGVAS